MGYPISGIRSAATIPSTRFREAAAADLSMSKLGPPRSKLFCGAFMGLCLACDTCKGAVRWVHRRRKCGSFPPAINDGDIVVGPAKMVREFVHDDMRDETAKRDVTTCRPFIEDRAAKDPHRVR